MLGAVDNNEGGMLSSVKELQKNRTANGSLSLVAQAEAEIDRLSALLSIPEETREVSMEIYREARRKHLIRGHGVKRMSVVAVFLASRKHRVPRTLSEIEDITMVKRKEILKLSKLLVNRLGMKFAQTSPLEYVGRFCAKLNLEKRVEEQAIEIIKDALQNGITSGKSPVAIASSAIYISAILCGNRRTLKEVAAATGVSDVTLRVRYNEMVSKLGIKIDVLA